MITASHSLPNLTARIPVYEMSPYGGSYVERSVRQTQGLTDGDVVAAPEPPPMLLPPAALPIPVDGQLQSPEVSIHKPDSTHDGRDESGNDDSPTSEKRQAANEHRLRERARFS